MGEKRGWLSSPRRPRHLAHRQKGAQAGGIEGGTGHREKGDLVWRRYKRYKKQMKKKRKHEDREWFFFFF
jgi:hypothetical protein